MAKGGDIIAKAEGWTRNWIETVTFNVEYSDEILIDEMCDFSATDGTLAVVDNIPPAPPICV